MPRQDSLYNQLKTVYELANKAECYDAADFIKRHIDETENKLREYNKDADERYGTIEELQDRIKWLEQHGKDCKCRECKIS